MLAGPNCPTKETVVVPSAVVSNVECLKHRPMPEMTATSPMTEIEIPVDTITTVPDEPASRPDKPYVEF